MAFIKKLSTLCVLVAFVLGMAVVSASAADLPAEVQAIVKRGKLNVGVKSDVPGFGMQDLSGDYKGMEIDLAHKIAEAMGLKADDVNCVAVTAKTRGQLVDSGDIDMVIATFTITPDRLKTWNFSTPYYVDNQAVAVLNTNTALTEENAAEALNSADITIAVQSGSTGADFAGENFPNAEIVTFPNFTDAFAAVQAGQADAVCGNLAVVDQMLSGAYTDQHTILTSATGEEYAIAVSKDNPELLDAINEAIATLDENGTLDELIAANMG